MRTSVSAKSSRKSASSSTTSTAGERRVPVSTEFRSAPEDGGRSFIAVGSEDRHRIQETARLGIHRGYSGKPHYKSLARRAVDFAPGGKREIRPVGEREFARYVQA